MGKRFLRLIGLFSKHEGGKHQVGSEVEVGNEYKRRERSKWKGPLRGNSFPGSNARLLILLGCLAWFLFCVLWKR